MESEVSSGAELARLLGLDELGFDLGPGAASNLPEGRVWVSREVAQELGINANATSPTSTSCLGRLWVTCQPRPRWSGWRGWRLRRSMLRRRGCSRGRGKGAKEMDIARTTALRHQKVPRTTSRAGEEEQKKKPECKHPAGGKEGEAEGLAALQRGGLQEGRGDAGRPVQRPQGRAGEGGTR